LEGHLSDCPDCAACGAAQRAFDAGLGAAMRAVAPPDGLRQRLHARLDADQAQRRRRLWLRRLSRVAAAAAVLALLWGGWLLVRSLLRPGYDGARAWDAVKNEDFQKPSDAGKVKEWFRQMGVETEAYAELHYEHLTFCGLTLFGDERQTVPYLIFQHDQDQATVRI